MIPIKVMHLIRIRAERKVKEIMAELLDMTGQITWRDMNIRGRSANALVLDEANWRLHAPALRPRRRKSPLPKVRKSV